jgi:hypothetical protein
MTTTPAPANDRIKSIDVTLRASLQQYKEREDLSLKELGKRLDYSEGMVSRYLGDRFEGDVSAIELKIRDLLKSDQLRATVVQEVETFPTLVTKQVHNALELIRRNSHVGLIFGDAGVGKSRAIGLYASKNPLTLLITLSRFSGSDTAGIITAIWRQLDTSSFRRKRDGNRGAFLVERLRGSGRMLVVDNAHRLTRVGREALFDFHDATGCPIALVGNPELLDSIEENDQQFSRVGVRMKAELKREAADAAAELIARVWPEAKEELLEVATRVVTNHGHLRSLWHQLRIAKELMSKGAKTPLKAFEYAHEHLVRNYSLAGD